MSQKLILHNAVRVLQKRQESPKMEHCDRFFQIKLSVICGDGNETTIFILSEEELRVEEGS